MTRIHEFNQDGASEALSALADGCNEEAIVLVLLVIADRLADLTEVLAAATQSASHDGRPLTPKPRAENG